MQNVLQREENVLMKEVALWEHSEADKGQIYTRAEVVDFMLDCIGLNDEAELENIRILEPSCGEGEFVVEIAKRLINLPKDRPTAEQLKEKVLAVDLVGASVDIAKSKVKAQLVKNGYCEEEINEILENWFRATDFLLEETTANFTHVIGNPPYVRVEAIPKKLLAEYRKKFSTMTDRADLYVPFFEKSLSLLREGGKLSFICTDRWTKNMYGRALRKFISEGYSLQLFIDLYGVDAFEREVMTYPAITQIVKVKSDQTILMHQVSFTAKESNEVLKAINGALSNVQIRKDVVNGDTPWLLGTADQIALVRKLENDHPTLEEVGCKVFIGAATGANKIYIVDPKEVEIEKSRLLPVITANELKTGKIKWRGKYMINTYNQDGVINLGEFPKLESYLKKYKEQLCKRHVAKKDGIKWFKTIDRVYESRAKKEKLLIPDISNNPIVIYDSGKYQPNNSIYYICSDDWDLQALKVILLSNVTKMFISIYSTKIAKGYLRFQAQHLRKLRLPAWNSIDEDLKNRMIGAGTTNDLAKYSKLACEMYGLSDKEKMIVGGVNGFES